MACGHSELWEFLQPAAAAVADGDVDMARCECRCGASLLVGYCETWGVQAELTYTVGGELVTMPVGVRLRSGVGGSPASIWARWMRRRVGLGQERAAGLGRG